MAIGSVSSPQSAPSILAAAQGTAQALEALLLQARQISSAIVSGWHGRRRAGSGDSFWQFRPYQAGEAAACIDWRRSARGDTLYIREREWEVAQTVFLCPDLRLSMRYQSRFARHSKEERAILLALVLAELLSQAGERIAMPHLLAPTRAHHGAERLALALHGAEAREATRTRCFDLAAILPNTHAIIISDFLDDRPEIEKTLTPLIERNIKAHLIEIADIAEETFPYRGHVEFHHPATGEKIRFGRADTLSSDYRKLYLARRTHLGQLAQRYGWSFYTSRTDQPLGATLQHLYLALSLEHLPVRVKQSSDKRRGKNEEPEQRRGR